MSVVVCAVEDDERKTSALLGQQSAAPLHVLPGSSSHTDDEGALDSVEVVRPAPTQAGQFLHQDDAFGPTKRASPLGETIPAFVADETS